MNTYVTSAVCAPLDLLVEIFLDIICSKTNNEILLPLYLTRERKEKSPLM